MNYHPILKFTFLIVCFLAVQASAQTDDEPYDTGAFDRIKWGSNELIKPYLACYAKNTIWNFSK
ncbi:MAG: hypothetical protein IPP63_13465 [Chloracidobacterium sp.]|nr:hypothetical protein [Chloracidobacterium sp.]